MSNVAEYGTVLRRALAATGLAAVALVASAIVSAHEPDETPPRAAFTAPPSDSERAGLEAGARRSRAPIRTRSNSARISMATATPT